MEEKKQTNQEKTAKSLSDYARYSNLAFQMIAIILIGVFGGIKLDQWLSIDSHIFTIILSFLFVCLSIFFVVKSIIQIKK